MGVFVNFLEPETIVEAGGPQGCDRPCPHLIPIEPTPRVSRQWLVRVVLLVRGANACLKMRAIGAWLSIQEAWEARRLDRIAIKVNISKDLTRTQHPSRR